jgi:hypothetical protein
MARPDDKVPTREQVADALRDYFRQRSAADGLEISEPFPQVTTVGPKVASNLQADALLAVFISIVGIIFYLALRFEFIYGLAGVIALIHDCMVAIGIMSVTDMLLPTTFPVKLNLNELAAVLTIIGFSINDTIVLFDRIREKSPAPRAEEVIAERHCRYQHQPDAGPDPVDQRDGVHGRRHPARVWRGERARLRLYFCRRHRGRRVLVGLHCSACGRLAARSIHGTPRAGVADGCRLTSAAGDIRRGLMHGGAAPFPSPGEGAAPGCRSSS